MSQDLATIFKEAEKTKNLRNPGETPMSQDLATLAKERGIKYFMISYTDLFGSQRAKLVPAVAIADMQKDGAGFAGFATWLDLTPAHPDLFGMPDPTSFIQLPWRKEVAWVAADCMMEDKYVDQAPRVVLKKIMAEAAKEGLYIKTGVECEFFLTKPCGTEDIGRRRHRNEVLLRSAGSHAPLRRHLRDLRLHVGARMGPLPERPRGRQRPVGDELELRRQPHHRRSSCVFQIHGEGNRREARIARNVYAQAVSRADGQWLPCAHLGLGQVRQTKYVL